MKGLILAINPGSTSTKVAIYDNNKKIIQKNLIHNSKEIMNFKRISDQLNYRLNVIHEFIKQEGYKASDFIAIVGRGGLVRPIPSGTYKITPILIKDLSEGYGGDHASNLGGQIAKLIADKAGIASYIVDPVAVDEFKDIARISGMPEIQRKSQLHALNIKAVSIRLAKEKNFDLNNENIIVVHLGGGISVCPIKKGKMIDVNNGIENGPFTPERTGTLPVMQLVELAYSGKYTLNEIKKKLVGEGGIMGYLGTNDAREVEKMIKKGNEKAKLIYDAMAYQIAKEIGAMATVLNGRVKYIILTGGLAYSKILIENIIRKVDFIAPVIVYPGEDEMKALVNGVIRVVEGIENVKIYEDVIKKKVGDNNV